MRKLLLVVTFLITRYYVQAQEFNCQVQIISPALQTSAADKQVLTELQDALREFINNTHWTSDNFKTEERIDLNLLINVKTQASSEEFGGSIQVTSRRTILNSNYYSTVFNFIDEDFSFRYQRGAAIRFSIDQHRDNLSSVIAFYAYMVLGYDYDSYSLEGGTKYFVKAQQIVSNAQGVPDAGWKASEGTRNRYWMVENALHQLFQPMRVAFYKYYRLGFDQFYGAMKEGMTAVFDALEEIMKIHKARPASFNVQLFFSAKVDELVNLFSCATQAEKTRAFNLLKTMDPANITKYNKITSATCQ